MACNKLGKMDGLLIERKKRGMERSSGREEGIEGMDEVGRGWSWDGAEGKKMCCFYFLA